MAGPLLSSVCLSARCYQILIGHSLPDIFNLLRLREQQQNNLSLTETQIDVMLDNVRENARLLAKLTAAQRFIYVMDEAQELLSVAMGDKEGMLVCGLCAGFFIAL